jgi:hypothetical protein
LRELGQRHPHFAAARHEAALSLDQLVPCRSQQTWRKPLKSQARYAETKVTPLGGVCSKMPR